MKYYNNPTTGETYREGSRFIKMLPEGTLFDGVPTEDQLKDWGFVEVEKKSSSYPPAVEARMGQIRALLASMDYLTAKELDGENMAQYGDYKQQRRNLRAEYNLLEQNYRAK